MSNLGQAALIVVGTVVGTYFGYPQLGFVIGSLAGAALFPTQLAPGPRISDNRTTTSAVGSPVSLLLGGTANLAGTVMWLAPMVEHQANVSQGGSGGPQQLQFNYTQSIAIGLAERVDDSAPDNVTAIAGITRIWENGTIVYDIRPQQAASSTSALDTLAETDEQYANRLARSAIYAETFTLYLGDELQEADPTMEAVLGVGNVPAFRSLAYMVYPNRALQIGQALRHPNFQFECYSAGVGNCVSSPETSNEVLYPWAGGGWQDPVNTNNNNIFQITTIDGNYTGGGWSGAVFSDEGGVVAALKTAGYDTTVQFIGYGATGGLVQAGTGTMVTTGPAGGNDPFAIVMQYNNMPADHGYYASQSSPGWGAAFATPNATVYLGVDSRMYFNDVPAADPYPALQSPRFTEVVGAGSPSFWYQSVESAQVVVTRTPASPPDPCTGLVPSIHTGFGVQLDGSLIECGPWTLVSGACKVLQIFDGISPQCIYPLNPCLLPVDPRYADATYWTAAYTAAVATGYMAAGKTYGVDYPVNQSFYYALTRTVCVGAGGNAKISDIIAAVCKRAGLMAIDVSDMVGITIDGYAVSSVCTGSSIITPLRSVGFFDAVETDGLLKFAARGKPIVATFTTDDFGAYDASQSTDPSKCPPSISSTRSQDEDLPRSIRLHYIATSRDYEDAEQDSPFRETKAINDVDITLPLCLGDTQAAQCAEVLWADSWAARNAHTLSVDQAWLALDAGDCIGVPVDGVMQRLRIANETTASAVLRKLSCVRDAEGAYISFAVASAPLRVPQTLQFIGPASFELLDLPCLVDGDSDPGFYIAAQRAAGVGSWTGATFYKSIDGGVTFTTLMALVNEATMGTLNAAVPASEAFTWDDVSVITVNVPASASFMGTTDANVLGGANAAAMGADGRWEIVQFGTATQVSATQWQLTHLLRGRRGTEHVIGTSEVGDSFVLITGDLGRVVLQTTEIGALRTYKGVSIGAGFATGTNQNFAGHAQALVPFSPVDATAHRLSDGDILISWFRRSRLGRTLMSGVDIPLGETSEAFQVDIVDASSPFTVLRTLSTSTTSVLYSHAHQETDFGSPLPTTLHVAIYQMSSIVGRGTQLTDDLVVT